MFTPPSPVRPRSFWRFLTPCWCVLFAFGDLRADSGLMAEDFAGTDGGLLTDAGAWSNVRGNAAVRLDDGRAWIAGEAQGEAYVAGPVFRGASVEAEFVLRFDPRVERSAEAGVFFQFTSADGRTRRGRVALEHDADGFGRLGVTARASQEVTWAAARLAPAEDHRVRLRYDSRTGTASLWVNPFGADPAPAAVSTDPNTTAPARVSFQQSARPHAPDIRVGSLRVRAADAPSGAVAPAARSLAGVGPWANEPGVAPPAADRFYVFLLTGQSNMAGRGVVEAEDRVGDPRILAWQPDGRWIVARDPLHIDKPNVVGVGPGLAFARALLPSLPEGAVIGLIPAAYGGSPISAWHKDYSGDTRWDDGATYYQRALDAARDAARVGRLAGVLWNQGESDAGRARSDAGEGYLRSLGELIHHLRTDLNAPELPFVAATLGPWRAQNAREFNAAVLRLPERVPHTATVNTLAPSVVEQLRNKPNDPPHYDSPSARLLGRLYAEAIKPLLGLPAAR